MRNGKKSNLQNEGMVRQILQIADLEITWF